MLRAAEIGLQLGYAYFVVDTADDRAASNASTQNALPIVFDSRHHRTWRVAQPITATG